MNNREKLHYYLERISIHNAAMEGTLKTIFGLQKMITEDNYKVLVDKTIEALEKIMISLVND